MTELVSIAIETSCKFGGVALGRGNAIAEWIDFDTSSRHATHLVVRLRELLARRGLKAADVQELYVSAGPGSFTGVRVGITVARTLAQAVRGLRCVSVPTTWAVAQNAAELQWQHLAVILDAKDELVYAQGFLPASTPVPDDDPLVAPLAEVIASAPKPLMLTGEGLLYQKPDLSPYASGEVTLADPGIYYPTARGVWTVGRELAKAGKFLDYHQLLPIYARRSEAERLWDLKHGKGG